MSIVTEILGPALGSAATIAGVYAVFRGKRVDATAATTNAKAVADGSVEVARIAAVANAHTATLARVQSLEERHDKGVERYAQHRVEDAAKCRAEIDAVKAQLDASDAKREDETKRCDQKLEQLESEVDILKNLLSVSIAAREALTARYDESTKLSNDLARRIGAAERSTSNPKMPAVRPGGGK